MSAPKGSSKGKKHARLPSESDSDSNDFVPSPKKPRTAAGKKNKARAASKSEEEEEEDEESESESEPASDSDSASAASSLDDVDVDDGGDGVVSAEFDALPDVDNDDDDEPEPDPANDSHNFAKLKECVIAKSHSNNWDDARTEWELVHIYEHPGGQCICEHRPITDHCVLRNKLDPTRELVVGNVCVGRFEDQDLSELSRLSFAALKRIKLDPANKRANKSMLTLCIKRKILGSKQGVFYLKRARRRSGLSAEDKSKMIKLTRKILFAFTHLPRACGNCHAPLFAQKSNYNGGEPYWGCGADGCKTAEGKMRYTYPDNRAARAAGHAPHAAAAAGAGAAAGVYVYPNPPPTLPVRTPVKQGDSAWCPKCRRRIGAKKSGNGEWFLTCYDPSHEKLYRFGLKQTLDQRA
jgi:hypothetical protein